MVIAGSSGKRRRLYGWQSSLAPGAGLVTVMSPSAGSQSSPLWPEIMTRSAAGNPVFQPEAEVDILGFAVTKTLWHSDRESARTILFSLLRETSRPLMHR
jgi:hypothetical protein